MALTLHDAINVALEYDPDISLLDLVVYVNRLRNVETPNSLSKTFSRTKVRMAVPYACHRAGIPVPPQLMD